MPVGEAGLPGGVVRFNALVSGSAPFRSVLLRTFFGRSVSSYVVGDIAIGLCRGLRQRGAMWDRVATLRIGNTNSGNAVSHDTGKQGAFYRDSCKIKT